MKEITLHSGEKVKVDDTDYELLSSFKWYKTHKGYAVRNIRKGDSGPLKMHRMVMAADKGQIVDHINRDKLDNRRDNLRFVSASESTRNRSVFSNNKSGHKNISAKPDGGYVLEIQINGLRRSKYSRDLTHLLGLRDEWKAKYGYYSS